MSVTPARLRTLVTALVVLVLGMSMTSGPASAVDGSLPDGFYLCHATTNASSPEGVKNWVTNTPSDSGQASGHAGAGHQNGLDVIPPIPGVLPQGQNWTAYGEQVHALGCRVPVDPEVSFTDSNCVGGSFVAPTASAPTYEGLNRATTGSVAPGQTYTVTYTPKPGYGIVGPSSFMHAYAASPADQAACAQPQPDVRRVPGSSSSCTDPAGVTTWVDVFTTPYVWDAAQRRWVPGQESGPVRNDETFTRYTDQQYFDACAGDRPDADERRVPDSSESCAQGGVTSWVDVWTTGYVWDAARRDWVRGSETGPVRADETFTGYSDQEYFRKCAPDQPADDVRREPMSDPSCALGGVTSWTDVFTTAYVWDAGRREWVRGDESDPVRVDETFTAYTDAEYQAACGGNQPAPDVRQVPMSDPSCAPAGVTSWTDVYSTPYVWSTQARAWVAGTETGPVRVGETFTAYTDQEFFDACAPDQPDADQRRAPMSDASCALGGITSWIDVYTTAYAWDLQKRAWVQGAETGPVRTAEDFTAYTDDEYFTKCAPARPDATERRAPMSSSSCAPAGVTSWADVYTTPFVWDGQLRDWVAGTETGPVRVGEIFTAYTDQEYSDACAPDQPDAEQRREPMSDASCALGGVTSWIDVYTTRYVWDLQKRAWVLGTETGPVRAAEDFTAYTDGEYFTRCAPAQPDAADRREPMSDESCAQGGVTSWFDLYTTPFVWDGQLRDWVAGTETGPVRVDDSFAPYTDQEYFDACGAGFQPAAQQRREPMSDASCALGGVTSWVDVYTTAYVWDVQKRTWVLGSETGPVRTAEDFTAYTDAEYFTTCAPAQPDADQRREPMSSPSCAPAGVTSWTDVYTTPYVWSSQLRDWVPGTETGPVKTGETFTAYTDGEYFTACAPLQPAADERREPMSDPSCALGGVTSWTDVFTTAYVWDVAGREWVRGDESDAVRVDELFTAYTDAEYQAACGGNQPAPDVRQVPMSHASCDLGGVTSWTDVYTTPSVWNPRARAWVAGTETGPVRVGETFTAYTDQEFFDACVPDQPDAEQRREPMSDASCDLGGVTSWTDVYTTPSVWSSQDRDWVAGTETGPVRVDESFTPYSDEEYFETCAPGQPDPAVRAESGTDESCELRGRTSWTDTWTTPYVWDAAGRAWVLGPEGDPVRTEEFVGYTPAEYEDACVDLEGEEETDHDRHHEAAPAPRDEVEVKGRQATAVPTVVDAGRDGVLGGSGAAGDRLWLLALGLLTFGLAGARRRARTRR